MRFVVPPGPAPAGAPAAAPTFAVVVAAYQAAGTIGDTLASVFAQTRPADEVIVVDDGSTDGLEGALGPFRDRLTLLRQANAGAPAARNAGVRAASAEFIAVLDADDGFAPTRLEALAALAAERPDLDILATDARFIMDGRARGRFGEGVPFAVDDQPAAILGSCFVTGWPAVRRSALLAIGGFDPTLPIAYDWDAALRLILAGARAGLVDEPLYDYRLQRGTLSDDRAAALWERAELVGRVADDRRVEPRLRRLAAERAAGHRARAVRVEAAGAAPDRGRLLRAGLARHTDVRTRVRAALACAGLGGGRSGDVPPADRFV